MSLPASGSESERQPRSSPVDLAGSSRARCSSAVAGDETGGDQRVLTTLTSTGSSTGPSVMQVLCMSPDIIVMLRCPAQWQFLVWRVTT